MRVICSIECEDCGKTLVIDPEMIALFNLEVEYMAMGMCFYCERFIYSAISKQEAEDLSNRGVKMLSWTES